MVKFKILQRILQEGIVAIIRADSAADAAELAEACIEGGVTTLEVSLTTPDGLDLIKTLGLRHGDRVLVGAGTVLDAETARLAILAGAKFILSPAFDAEVVRLCNRYQVVSMPGVATATEVVSALAAGADIVKIFPADTLGPEFFKALLAPLPHAPLMPSGGVTLKNMKTWFANGAVAVGVGGSLTGPGRHGDYATVTSHARAFVETLREYRRETFTLA
jgi:2-dehydro-3-deoxyphosphogluconate aldolase / (4S)-4-hydroxy-2-oxoglutarate aldolase